MTPTGKKNALKMVLIIFMLCSVVKHIEFLLIKTDRTIISENIICKLFIIVTLFIVLSRLRWNWKEIGFCKKGILRTASFGLLLGISTFFISYLVEYFVLVAMGKTPHIRFFITNFALTNQNIGRTSLAMVVICIIGNIINVWAEEGLFRGLFFQITKTSFTEKQSNFIQSLLFGMWHIVTVIVWLLDGSINIPTACFMAVGYIILSGILAYEWGLCISLTGTVWAGVFEHFFNNFITNSLHMVTDTGTDEMQILRIVLSNALSLTFVLIISKNAKKQK
ncbi:MAG: CPBP family intramembrane metalloprotease [Ruminococcaceae bacterium]|nr:CPBP family intramembrane metalloprotease [Oscillospiraceae bacterium]